MAVVHNGRVSWFEDTFQSDYTMPGGLYQFRMKAFSRKTGQIFYQNMSYQVMIPVNGLKINSSTGIVGGEAILCSGEGYPKPSFYWEEQYIEFIDFAEEDIRNEKLSIKGDVLKLKDKLPVGFRAIMKCIGKNTIRDVTYEMTYTFTFVKISSSEVNIWVPVTIMIACLTSFMVFICSNFE